MEVAPSQDKPGVLLARGLCRHLHQIGHACLCEFTPARGLRVDVMSLAPDGEIWIIECKSSRSDYMCDAKWENYLEWCDRYFWCVDAEFPTDILPETGGIFIADAYGADLMRDGSQDKLPGARRSKLTRKFARDSATRLLALLDPFCKLP